MFEVVDRQKKDFDSVTSEKNIVRGNKPAKRTEENNQRKELKKRKELQTLKKRTEEKN